MSRLISSITPAFFRGGKDTDAILEMLYTQKASGSGIYKAMGQLVGRGADFEDQTNTITKKDGTAETRDSIFIAGEFEAVCFMTGEVTKATGAYLPAYFAKMIKAMIKSGDTPMFAVEIGVELTGRSIPWGWVVTDLVPADKDSPLEKLKAKLPGGTLKLPSALIGNTMAPNHPESVTASEQSAKGKTK